MMKRLFCKGVIPVAALMLMAAMCGCQKKGGVLDNRMAEDSLTVDTLPTDSMNNNAPEEETPRDTDSTRKVIYLTFDDGPSPNTPKILKVLKENGVHATFFVTAQYPKNFCYLTQAAKEGNAIAAHTYSHNFNIYSSMDAYFNDLEMIEKVIEKYTGKRSRIIRFPGGSSNSIFHKYNKNPMFMINLTKEVQKRGYQYVDWNGDSKDASTVYPTAQLVSESACRATSQKICMLMHDAPGKEGTVEALPAVIRHFKSLGYDFQTITSTEYVCHHGIRGYHKSAAKRKKDKHNRKHIDSVTVHHANKTAHNIEQKSTVQKPAEKNNIEQTETEE